MDKFKKLASSLFVQKQNQNVVVLLSQQSDLS